MIRQYEAQQLSDNLLKQYQLYDKGWRTIFSKNEQFIGRCWHDTKRIELSLMHLNVRSDRDVEMTIKHEIAHAIVGHEHGHDSIWEAKAKELGCDDAHAKSCIATSSVANGKAVQPYEVKPKRTFNRVDATCPICSKKAIESSRVKFGETQWIKLECGHLVKKESIKQEGFDFSNWESTSGKKPFPYQIEGIRFLEASGGRALIADEPGLGKTIQADGFLLAHQDVVCPALWICKTTLKLQAFREALDWCGPTFLAQIIASPKQVIIPGMKLYIISMDLLRNMPVEKFKEIGFKTIIADEIQHFKNPDSARTGELRKLVAQAEHFIPLSGTPWKNRGDEYFSVLNMLDPVRFPSYANFDRNWVDYVIDKKTGKWRRGGIKNIPAFRQYTKDIIIRRMRDDVLPDLPKINRHVRYIDMEDIYKKAYEKAEENVASYIKDCYIGGDNLDIRALQGQIMQLKHITGLAKVQVAIEDITEFLENTPDEAKLVVFHHHIDVGDYLQNGDPINSYTGLDTWLLDNEYDKTLRLYGGRSPEERDRVIQEFKNNPRARLLIASTLASGEGLNIQFCQNAMMLERQWNPANEEQAELRFSRPLTITDLPDYLKPYLFDSEGKQKKSSVDVPYMIADGTVDSMLTEIVERKRVWFNKTMNDKDANITWEESSIMTELADMIMKKRGRKVA